MIKKSLALATLVCLVFFACKENKHDVVSEQTTTPKTETTVTEVITKTLTNPDGSAIVMAFDLESDKAVVEFNDEKIELISQKPASGIWYKNEAYELRGKGESVDLSHNGEIVFSHKGEEPIVTDYTSADGKSLTISVYNDTEMATVVYEDEIIDLKSQRPASGVWFKNDTYEFRGKGDDVVLRKGEEEIFKSK